MVPIRVGIGLFRGSINKISGDASDIIYLSEALSKNGIGVVVFSCNTKSARWERKEIEPSYKIDYYCDHWSIARIFEILLKFMRYIRSNANRFDIIQLHFPSPIMAVVTDFVKLFTRKPIVTNLGGASLGESLKILPLVKKSFFRYIARVLVNSISVNKFQRYKGDAYIVSSNYQREKLILTGLAAEKVKVIRNSIPLDFKNDNQKGKNLGGNRKSNCFTVGYLGHFTANKGVEVLLMVFERINRVMGNWKFILAWSGVGNKRNIIQSIRKLNIDNKLRIVGEVKVSSFLSSLDVLVLPYLNEVGTHWYPHCFLEAMASGVPIVTSEFKIIKEIVGDSDAAILTEPGNIVEIFESIVRVSNEPGLRDKMVRDQREIIKEFDADEIAKQHIGLYEEILIGQKK